MAAQLATPPVSRTRQTHGPARRISPLADTEALRLSFENVPVLFAGVLFAAGIFFAGRVWIAPGLLLTATVLAGGLCAFALRIAPRIAWLPLACMWCLLGGFALEMQPTHAANTPLLAAADGQDAVIHGVITRTTTVRQVESPMTFSGTPREEHSESIDVRLDSVATGDTALPLAGGLRATVYSPLGQPFPVLRCGDRIKAELTMHEPERYLDPEVWDATAWLRQQGVDLLGSVRADDITVTRSGGRPPFWCWLHALQQAGSERLLAFAEDPRWQAHTPRWLRISAEDAGMLSAIVLGDRSYLQREARAGFERTGSFHLLVVSGLHLAIFAGLVFAVTRRLRLGPLYATGVTIAGSFAYALLTGFGQPVQRSFWMVALFLIARLLFRERNSLNALGFAVLCLLAWDPRSLASASFQMTLLSVIALAGIARPLAEHTFAPYLRATRNLSLIALDSAMPPRVAQFRVTLRLIGSHLKPIAGKRIAEHALPTLIRLSMQIIELVVACALIELAMSLPMAIYFHRVTALGLPVNVLVLPLIGIALPAALLTFIVILIATPLAVLPAAITGGMLHLITAIVYAFGRMGAGDIRVPEPGAIAIVCGVLLIAVALWTSRNSRFPVSVSIAALCCAVAVVLYPRPLVHRPGTLEVTALDVGQGDSLLVVSPQGGTLLIDAGGPIGGASTSGNFEIGEDVVSPVLWSRNIRRLDAVALTHAHSDHMGGMFAVLRNMHPRELWVGNNPDIPAYDALLAEAAQLGVRVRHFAAGDSFDFAGTQVRVLAPEPDYTPGPMATNNDSLVLRLSYGATSAVLEGDAEAPSENAMLDEDLGADFLKVGHHGSKTSTTPAFLAAVHPRYALISVGHRNPYGHPRFDVLLRLQAAQVRTYRTDTIGATSFYLDGNNVIAQPLAQH